MKYKLLTIFILSVFINLNADEKINYPQIGVYKDTPFRIDETLEKIASGKSSKEEFEQKKGTLIVYNPNDLPENKFVVEPGDDVRISCTAGWCRSQTLYLIFKMYKGITLLNPHGTRDYFDPSIGKAQWNKNIQKENELDEFEACFGLKKAKRVGHDQFDHLRGNINVGEEMFPEFTKFYNENYFGPESKNPLAKRIVYITFAANAHAILYRLNQTNEDLSNHVLVCIDTDDYISKPIKEWETFPKSIVGYTKFAKLIMNFFDFSHLEFKDTPGGQPDPFELVKKIVFDSSKE